MDDQSPPAIVEDGKRKPDLLAQLIADAQMQAEKDAQAPQPVAAKPKSKDSTMQNVIRFAALALGAGLDVHSTNRAMHTPGLGEKNSWLYGKRPSLARLIATKTAINAPMLYIAHKIAEKSGKVDAMMPVAISAAKQGAAGMMNYHLINKQKKRNEGVE